MCTRSLWTRSGWTWFDSVNKDLQICAMLSKSNVAPVIDEAKSAYRPFRFTWITMGLSDSAAWYITLANAALYRDFKAGTQKPEYYTNSDAMKWYTKSLSNITKRLQDPAETDGEGLVVAITGFICHDVCLHRRHILFVIDLLTIHRPRLEPLIAIASYVTFFILPISIFLETYC